MVNYKDLTLKNYFDKVTYTKAPDADAPGKITVSAGIFVQNIVIFKLIKEIEKVKNLLKRQVEK